MNETLSEASSFQEQLRDWKPADSLPEGAVQEWSVNADGSVTITLPAVIAFNLADELLEWREHGRSWVDRPDCQNWKRSPIARENRRETIVYSNVFSSIACLLGRRGLRALLERVAAIKREATP